MGEAELTGEWYTPAVPKKRKPARLTAAQIEIVGQFNDPEPCDVHALPLSPIELPRQNVGINL
jgi:hypothetical protein